MNSRLLNSQRDNDRTIETAWRLILSLMIFGTAVCTVMLVYASFFAAIGNQWPTASTYLVLATALGSGVAWLCYNRNDLAGVC